MIYSYLKLCIITKNTESYCMKVNDTVYKLNTKTGELSEPLKIEDIHKDFFHVKITVEGEEHRIYESSNRDKDMPEFLFLSEALRKEYERYQTYELSSLSNTMVKFMNRHFTDEDRQEVNILINRLNEVLSKSIDNFEEKERFPSYARMWNVKGLDEEEIRLSAISRDLQDKTYKELKSK